MNIYLDELCCYYVLLSQSIIAIENDHLNRAIFQMLMGLHRNVDGDHPAEIPVALRPAIRPADSNDAHLSTTVPLNPH